SLIDQNIKIFKLDVEGYELEVLKGAENLLDKKKIENILYEDHVGYPSKVSQYLERKGYHIFKINKGFWQPLLQSPTVTQKILYEPPNYIATHNPFSLKKTMARKGWRIYSK